MNLKIELTIDNNKKKALKNILKSDEQLILELQKLADRYVNDMILSYYRGKQKIDDALNEINK